MTTSERSARINRQFERSFGVFDGRMRDEQAVIAGQRGGRGGSGQGNGTEAGGNGAAAGAGNGEGEGGESGDGKSANGQAGGGQNGSGAGGSSGSGERGNGQSGGGGYGGGAKGAGGPSTVPAGIPDGSDDDVVARQLREAATNETDAELREKLWQEYRNYKKSAG